MLFSLYPVMFEFVYSIQNIFLKNMQKMDKTLKSEKFKMLFMFLSCIVKKCYVMFVFRKNDVTCE